MKMNASKGLFFENKVEKTNRYIYFAIVRNVRQADKFYGIKWQYKELEKKSICKHLRHSRSIFFVFQKLFTSQRRNRPGHLSPLGALAPLESR